MNSNVVVQKMKEMIISTVANSKEGHLPSSFSILDILWVLYDRVLNVTPSTFHSETRDRFFLSKGHASVGLYAVLAEKGFFSKTEFKNFCTYNSNLGGHPDRNKVPGAEVSSGSLGHGFPISVGAALGLKIKGISSKVFVLIGDGEANEGTIWESALLAAHHKLDNLCLIVDYNHSTDRALMIGDLSNKFKSFDWDVVEVKDGHDHEAIFVALNTPHHGKPLAVVCQTVKGKGLPSIEGDPAWHHRSPTAEEAERFIKELV
jgi:transketolase